MAYPVQQQHPNQPYPTQGHPAGQYPGQPYPSQQPGYGQAGHDQQAYAQPQGYPQQQAYPQQAAQPAYAQAPQQYAAPQHPDQQQYAGQQYTGQYAPAQQAQQPAQPQYAAQQPAQNQTGGYWSPDGGELSCRFCGSVPAVKAKFRGHQGMIIIMKFLSLDGPFCRDCGLATYRTMTARTLVQGWWGYASFVFTPLTVLFNLIPRGKVAKLPAPRPAAHGQSRQPMDPGAPLLARPMALAGLAIPFVLILLLVLIASTG